MFLLLFLMTTTVSLKNIYCTRLTTLLGHFRLLKLMSTRGQQNTENEYSQDAAKHFSFFIASKSLSCVSACTLSELTKSKFLINLSFFQQHPSKTSQPPVTFLIKGISVIGYSVTSQWHVELKTSRCCVLPLPVFVYGDRLLWLQRSKRPMRLMLWLVMLHPWEFQ